MKQLRILALALAFALGCNSSSGSSSVEPARPVAQVSSGPGAPAAPADPRESLLARSITSLLEEQHLRSRPLDDQVSREAFAQYLEYLDGGKMFLLQEHVDALRGMADQLDDQMRSGSLVLAHRGAALLQERLAVVEKVVAEQLKKPFDFTVDEAIETDPEKRGFATTEAELADRWRRALKLEVLVRTQQMVDTLEARAEREAEEAKTKGKKASGKKAAGKKTAGKKTAGKKTADEKTADEAATPADPNVVDGDDPPLPDREPIPETDEGREQKAREDLAKRYAGTFARRAQEDPMDGLAMFINAVTSIYDPHTAYLPPQTKENFDIQMSGSLEGIGAVLTEDDHYIRVQQIVPGGASWRQGELEAGDLIIAVAQAGKDPVDVVDMRVDKVVQMIRGPKGTIVELTIQKPDDQIQIISITRDVVEIEAAYARGAVLKMGKGSAPIGFIELPSFYGNTRTHAGNTPERSCTDDVRRLLEAFAKRKVERVVLDLRGNGGGLLGDAQNMSGLFIPTGPIVQTRGVGGEVQVLEDRDPGVAFDGDLIVLVDSFSASASEILAAALQDYGRALIVGTDQTHGKGTVQVILDLDRMMSGAGKSGPLGFLKLTREQFFRISGGSTQARGVVPDVLLPNPTAHFETGERNLDHAIPWSQVDPLQFQPWNKASWDKATLTARSQARQAKDPVFAKIQKRTQLLEARREQTKVQLARDAWMAQREQDRKALEAVTPELSEGPARLTVDIVDYDGKQKPEARPGGKDSGDPTKMWADGLARDPWVAEAVRILGDMSATKITAK